MQLLIIVKMSAAQYFISLSDPLQDVTLLMTHCVVSVLKAQVQHIKFVIHNTSFVVRFNIRDN